MASLDIDELLQQFDGADWSVRLVHAVCAVVPFAPEVPDAHSLVELVKVVDPNATRPVMERAAELVREPHMQRALWMGKTMHTAGAGIGLFSGVNSAYKLYQAGEGEKLDALETDPQQAADAVIKALALAFVIAKLFDGGPLQKVEAFRATTTGQAILVYFAAVDVGLPFADNALLEGGTLMSELIDRYAESETDKLAAVAGAEEALAAKSVLLQLKDSFDKMGSMAAGHLKPVAGAVSDKLSGYLDAGDKAAGAAATAADVLPVYRFLITRLVAEVAVQTAIADAGQAQAAREAVNPGLVPVKVTRSQAADLPDAPPARRSCLPFFVALLSVAASSATLAVWWVAA